MRQTIFPERPNNRPSNENTPLYASVYNTDTDYDPGSMKPFNRMRAHPLPTFNLQTQHQNDDSWELPEDLLSKEETPRKKIKGLDKEPLCK